MSVQSEYLTFPSLNDLSFSISKSLTPLSTGLEHAQYGMAAVSIVTDVVPVYLNTQMVGSFETAILVAKTKMVSPIAYSHIGFVKVDILT